MRKIISLGLLLTVMFVLTACAGTTSVAASTIAIDVNPSVILELGEDDKVINVILNNDDAVIIVGDMDFVGVDYNIAVNALIGSMVSNGYINELTNSVLLSVQSNDEIKENELMTEITKAVSDTLTGASIDGSVITQDLDFDQEAKDLAATLQISEAKAELVLDIIKADPRMTVEELALLSINDLNLLLEAKNIVLEDTDKIGNASELGIISVEEVYQISLRELGIEELNVVELEIELEQEDGTIIYEVEIDTQTEEFEILIDAKEGTVFIDLDEDDDDDEDDFPLDSLSEQEVLEMIALELGIEISLITELEVDQEMEKGVAYYEVEFEINGTEYEVEVDALTGEIYTNSMDEHGFDFDDDNDGEEDEEDEEETN
ncbi:hypothetical protein CI105_08315 [Candidatus Izimaplasma bacterium ZiA1]|uniref:PepSY domain-containing protein n=1 Tax=Candidatus Izimoplasma sp. ZiA1 TaxID=2024899 RepID=UPI000BAA7541|nr:hypothetical protein CI105_08315 [Candidatus Izimaplasma bacterium ZiA1]